MLWDFGYCFVCVTGRRILDFQRFEYQCNNCGFLGPTEEMLAREMLAL